MVDDIFLQAYADSNPTVFSLGLWRSFVWILMEYKPAIATTTFCDYINAPCKRERNKNGDTNVYAVQGYNFDAAFNAFHHDALSYVLPYRLKNENESWWYSQIYVSMLARHYFKGHVLIYGNVNTVNVKHVAYPRRFPTDVKQLRVFESEIEQIIKTENRQVPEWKGKKSMEYFPAFTCKC